MGIPPVRGSSVKRRGQVIYSSHLGQFFRVFVFLQASYLVSFPTPDLPWEPPLGAHLPLSQDGSQSEASWEEQDSYGLAFSLEFWPKKPFCACAVSPLSQKSEFFNHTGLCPLFILAVTITLRCLQETNTGYLLSVVISISEGKQEADWKYLAHLTLPSEMLTVVSIHHEIKYTYLCPMKCKQEASYV